MIVLGHGPTGGSSRAGQTWVGDHPGPPQGGTKGTGVNSRLRLPSLSRPQGIALDVPEHTDPMIVIGHGERRRLIGVSRHAAILAATEPMRMGRT